MSDIVPVNGTNGSNGKAAPLEIAPLTTGPGTDFKAFAIGAGANLEGLPAYFVDPLLATGNMPGLAISSLNNRALRQGTFVASSLCQWISNQSQIYVPDDGSQINWISEWQNALAAFVAALIPAGPDLGAYLPLAGGQMVGNIRFQSGISTILENNTWYFGRDTGGQARGLIIRGSDNFVYINDGSATQVRFNGIPIANNNVAWSGKDTGANIRSVIGLLSDNDIHIGSSLTVNIRLDVTGSVYLAGNIVLANNRYVYGNDTGGTARALLGLDTLNRLSVGLGVQATTDIYGPTGIGFRNNATAYGLLTVNGYTYLQGGARSYIPGGNDPHQIYADAGFYARHHYLVGGTRDWTCGCWSNGTFGIADESAHAIRFGIDLSGNITAYNALTVNGVLYAASAASVSGGLTVYNSLNVASGNVTFAGSLTQCWDAYFGGSIFVGSLQAYNNGGWFYFVNGVHANTLYSRGDCTAAGSLYASSWVQGGYIHSTGDIRADNSLHAGNSLDAGYIRSYGAVDAGHVYSFDYLHSDGNLDVRGSGSIANNLAVSNGMQLSGLGQFYNDIRLYGNGVPGYNANSWWGTCEANWWAMFCYNYVTASSASIKQDIAPVPIGCLDLVSRIKPKTFKYITSPDLKDDHGNLISPHHGLMGTHWGFVYQDVAEVMHNPDREGPDFAGAYEDMGNGLLAYNELTAVLWQAVRELSATVRELSDEITTLKATVH